MSGDQRDPTTAAAKTATSPAAAAAAVTTDTLRILRSLGQLQKRDSAVLREVAAVLTSAAEMKRLSVRVSLLPYIEANG